ncbi:hypothetical protein HO133_007944 [Letharia lupina]|uniref:Uncharacterized protein n=1 Tax=Letharia lupina TaxID=560253 RepID=A0A8H6FHP3_9LECA|nr:uncharacterized protein HO133_007944 [Letharia lupina]KAF6228214.1 hypothetical protein HO133_007944 [Letharia lupina]
MPLSELPSYHPARNAIGQSQDDVHDGNPRTGPLNGDENSNILKNPSSIQSMLRNTTETGNVGQFSIKPSRVPPSLPRPSKARATPSKQRQPGAYYNRDEDTNIRHTPLHSRQETTASNGPGFQNQIPRSHRGPARSPSIEDYRSYSTTKSSYASHSLTTHHPHTNGGHGGPGGPHNLRPRSPFAYPTRLKRPGYRPSSPALSEFNKQNRSQTSLHRRPSFRTNSPSSLHTNGAPSPWRKGVNRSDPLLRYYPQSAVPISGRAPSPSPTSTRPHTPKASPSVKSIASSTNGLQATPNGSWINSQIQTPSPIFYDYTEAFEEQGVEQQDYSHYVSMSAGTLAEHPMLDTATTTYYELDASPDSTGRTELPSEDSIPKLKTQSTDNRFDQTTSQFEVDDQSSIQALHKDLSEVPELPEGDLSNAEADVAPTKHDDVPIDQEIQYPFPKQASPLMATTGRSKQFSDQELCRESPLQVENLATTSRTSESPKRRVSSPIESIHSTHPAPQPVPEWENSSPKDPEAVPSSVASPPPVGQPAAGSDHGKGHEGDNRRSLQLVRATSFEDHSGNEHTVTEIVSPTPERSIISPNSVSRFSKILSINDDLLNLDELASRIKGKDRADGPMQGTMDSRPRVARIEPPWRKRSVQLRDIATRQNAADYALVEASDSEDEPELTQGLRQTFCKPDERPLDNRSRSPPITLPSQLVHRGYPGPLSIRRSPAVRRSTSDLRKVRDPPVADPDQDLGSPEESLTHVALTLEAKKSIPLPLDSDQKFESPREYTVQEDLTPDIKPPPSPNKELPPLPSERPAVVSLSPPVAPRLPSLPFSFTPLIQRRSEDETASAAEPEPVASSCLDQGEEKYEDEETEAPIPATQFGPDRTSIASSPDSRPWNLDTSYPWSDQQPKLEVTMPEPTEDPNQSTRSLPRFRFKIQRASSTTEGTAKITKYPSSSDASPSQFASSYDAFQGTAFRWKRYPTLSVMPGQINSSHDVIRSSPNQTRFVESFETQSPRITLVPPSPGFEARSFFSDDSSQVRPRGAFRKRFSALRNRAPRGASTDEPRGYDRGLLSSALGRSRASGRSSRQSENTAITAGASSRASQTKRARRKLVKKLRSWWQRGEDRVREWRWRRRYNGAIDRSVSADLYAGV